MHLSQPEKGIISEMDLMESRPKLIIAVDGYSNCGKSTTARQVAARLGYSYIDTGAMYRTVTLFFLQSKVLFTDSAAVKGALSQITISFQFNRKFGRNETYLNGHCVEDEIRKLYVANSVSKVSALPEIRRAMVELQHQMGKERGIVMDGRDIGTHVFPDAELKIFMTADPLIRAQRRQAELLDKGHIVGLNEVLESIKKRDRDDCTRSASPLCQAKDACLLDTSYLSINQQIDWVMQMVTERINRLNEVTMLEAVVCQNLLAEIK